MHAMLFFRAGHCSGVFCCCYSAFVLVWKLEGDFGFWFLVFAFVLVLVLGGVKCDIDIDNAGASPGRINNLGVLRVILI